MGTNPLQKYLYWSLGLHVGAALALFIIPGIFSSSHRINKDKVVWVSVPLGKANQLGTPLKKATALPKNTITEQKDALKSPPPGQKPNTMTHTQAPKTPPKQTPPPPKQVGHPDSRIENALARMQQKVASKPVEQTAAQVPDGQPGGFEFGSANANNVPITDPEYVLYQAKIRQKIMDQWIVPLKFVEQGSGLICRIIVHMNERGEVTQTEWETKSANPAFDLSAERAVQKASPLDIPPDRLKDEVLNEGFIVEFKPQAAAGTSP